ncbi:MAG: alpha/beta hydrolase [Verrucomicrobia bacterium]|nr:MAG: alpha/beta hydrolase [Verrucomicrobiota bacterium]
MRPVFLFAPGAGAPSSHPWMQRWKQRLTRIDEVETFDYDYMREGRRRPDRLPQLIAAHRAALAGVRAKTSGPIFLIGKSMGGRIGCHVALEDAVNGVVCLGSLCPLDLLESVRSQMTAPNFLHVVEGGDHSLIVRKKDLGSETQEDVDQRIAKAISDFVAVQST